MISRLIFYVLSGMLGLYLAYQYLHWVQLTGPLRTLLLAGVILGIVNFFIKPILDFITLPLRILTLGLVSLFINMVLVWFVVDVLFPQELSIPGIIPLLETTVLVWALTLFFGFYGKRKKKKAPVPFSQGN